MAIIRTSITVNSTAAVAGFNQAAAASQALTTQMQSRLGPAHARVTQQARATSAALQQTAKSSMLSGNGMMQLAYFADDAQYGLRGIMNNIPGLVMSLGAGAGLAGAASLAVLAFAKLGPAMGEVLGVTDKVGDAMKALDEVQKKVIANFNDQRSAMAEAWEAQRKLVAEKTRFIELENAISNTPSQQSSEDEINVMKRKAEMQKALIKTTAELAAASAKTDEGRKSAMAQGAVNAGAVDEKSLQAELAIRAKMEEDLLGVLTEKMKLGEQQVGKMADESRALEDQVKQMQRKKLEQQELKDAAEKTLETMKAQGFELKKPTEYSGSAALATMFDPNATMVEKVAAPWKILNNTMSSTIGAMNDFDPTALNSAIAGATAEASRLDAEIAAAKARSTQLEEGITGVKTATDSVVESLNQEAARQQKAIDEAREKLEVYNQMKTAAQALAAVEAQALRAEKEKAALEKYGKTAATIQEYEMETKIAQLRQAGRSAEAKALAKEMSIRRDAASLESAGVEKSRALDMARQRAAADGPGAPASNRLLSERIGGLSVGGVGTRSAGTRLLPYRIGGLRAEAARSEAAANVTTTDPAADAATRYYDQSLAKQAELVEAFKRLGVI